MASMVLTKINRGHYKFLRETILHVKFHSHNMIRQHTLYPQDSSNNVKSNLLYRVGISAHNIPGRLTLVMGGWLVTGDLLWKRELKWAACLQGSTTNPHPNTVLNSCSNRHIRGASQSPSNNGRELGKRTPKMYTQCITLGLQMKGLFWLAGFNDKLYMHVLFVCVGLAQKSRSLLLGVSIWSVSPALEEKVFWMSRLFWSTQRTQTS